MFARFRELLMPYYRSEIKWCQDTRMSHELEGSQALRNMFVLSLGTI